MDPKRTRLGCFRIGCGLVISLPLLIVLWYLTPRTTTLWLFGRRPTSAQHQKDLGGERVAAVLAKPDRAEAILLKPPEGEPRVWPAHELVVASEPKQVGSATSAEIAKTLISRSQ